MKALDRLLINFRNYFHRGIARLFNYHYNVSFSQSGEDMIGHNIFTALQIPKPNYIDLSAHHPTFLSNTFMFNGHRIYSLAQIENMFAELILHESGLVFDDFNNGIITSPDPAMVDTQNYGWGLFWFKKGR